MSLTTRLIQVATKKIFTNPQQIQKTLLEDILENNKNSEFGKKHDFNKIKTINDFQEAVPIIKYDDILEYVEKIKQGEQNILTSDKIIFLATSSGTTSNSKFIPVTERRYKDFFYENILWNLNTARYSLGMFFGKMLYFTGARTEGFTEGGIPYGSLSGFIANRFKNQLKNKIAVSNKIFESQNFEEKMRIYIEEAVPKDVRNISFTYPIELKMFFEAVSKTNKKIKKMKDIWPNLSVIACYKKGLEDYPIDDILDDKLLIIDHGIRASEGTISIGTSPRHRSGIPAIQQTFLEFKEQDTENVLLVDELEINKSYDVLLTTHYGLYRYEIGDIIKVTHKYKNLPLFEFEARTSCLDLVGEHCPHSQIEKAINHAKKTSKMVFVDYAISPSYKTSENPHYEIFLEKILGDEQKYQDFLNNFDSYLQENVRSYGRMRTYFNRLDFPEITLLREGSFNEINKLRIMKESQPKTKFVRTDKQFREDIKQYLFILK